MAKKILVVDDSPSILNLVSFTLQNAGYQVITSVDGQDALSLLDESDIRLVITDLHMPNRDGISLIRDIRSRKNYQYLPIIVLTTESQAEKKEEARGAGATGWIVKPFDQAKLLAVVQKLIR